MQLIKALLVTGLLCAFAAPSQAATITSYTAGTNTASTLYIGQSITTPIGDSWDNLSFNFFSDTSGGTTPSAAGTLFLLSSEYLGTPSDLSSLTTGFIAQSTSIVGNKYFFDPGVTILGGTQYFFYTNALVLVSGSNVDQYIGGNAYIAPGAGSNYAPFAGDANFQLEGTVAASTVPEPASMLLVGTGLLGAGVWRWRQKRA
jgi:hypothetical protein